MLKKRLLVIGGTLSLGLGVVGMFLPVLPTTPFLLLAAYCYLRGSRRLYDWLMNNRLLGGYIQNYIKYRAVSRSAKIASLIVLWLSLSISIAVIGGTAIRIVLVLVGAGVSIHLLTLKTLPKETSETNASGRKDITAEDR